MAHNTDNVRSLEQDMLAYFPSPPLLKRVTDETVAKWQAFCALPEEIKVLFGYTGDERFSGAGYELKRGGGFDLKEDFHVRRDKKEFLYAEAQKIGAREAIEFLDASMALYEQLDPVIEQFATFIEDTYAQDNLVRDVLAYKDSLILRFLHYFGGRSAHDVLGDPHPDKGGFTGHLYESHPGVERLTIDGQWVPMDVDSGETAFFAGLGLQHRTKCLLRSPWHRIVANAQTANEGRWSAVCFSNIANGRYYDKQRVGRTQGLPQGLSYKQSFEEFDTLFMD